MFLTHRSIYQYIPRKGISNSGSIDSHNPNLKRNVFLTESQAGLHAQFLILWPSEQRVDGLTDSSGDSRSVAQPTSYLRL